jgi:hypothetical protein
MTLHRTFSSLALPLGALALALAPACGKMTDNGQSTPSTGWQGQRPLEGVALGSSAKAAAVDGFGNALALWEKTGSTNLGLWGNLWDASGGWQGDGGVPFGNAVLTSISPMNVAMAVGGTGAFTYVCDPALGSDDSNVWAGRYQHAAGMATPVQLNASGTYACLPAVASGTAGNAAAVWLEARASTWVLMAAVCGSSSNVWSTPFQVSDGTTNAWRPLVGVDSQGDVVAAWTETDNPSLGPYTLWVARYSADLGSWSAPAQVRAGSNGVSQYPALAMTDAGAQIAWSECLDGQTYQIHAIRWSPTTDTWTTPVRVSALGVTADHPALGADAQGNALLAWIQFPSGQEATDVYCANYTKASGWQNVQGLGNATGTRGVGVPQLSVNASGNAAMAFLYDDGATWRVASALFDAGWGNAGLVQSSTGGDAENPSVCVGAGGTILVLWDQVDATGITRAYGNLYLQ